MSTCPQCDQPGIFGYRDKNTSEMTWYCTTHRLGQHWADALREACAAGCTPASPVRENAVCPCPPAVTSERASEALVP